MDWVADGHVIDEHIVPPPAVPDIISDRQFFQQLALQGEITQDEALAYVQTGTLPARLSTALDQAKASGQMTDLEAFNAKMTIVGATEFRRSHSLVPMLAAIFSKSPAEIDQIWRDASLL